MDEAPPPRPLRTFVALDLDDHFLDEAVALGERLRDRLARATWGRREAMHVTLRFFGDTDAERIDSMREATAALASGRGAMRVRAASLGAFPDARRARVIVLDLADEGGALGALARDAEAAAVALGFAPEERGFSAHLTLARVRQPQDVRQLVAATRVAIDGRVIAIALYAVGGPLYTPLAPIPLA